MDVVNISRSRRFLRERPIHVNLFDRPRLVVDLLCLEPEQEEARRGFDRSDSLLVLIEGEARLHTGVQIESLQAMDAVLVPPGQEYRVTNTGTGQMTALVILSPKPTRSSEVRIPGDTRPFRTVRPDRDGEGGAHERPPRPRPNDGENGQPRRDRSSTRRDDGAQRGPYPRREGTGGRTPYPRRDGAPSSGAGRAPYPRRDGAPASGTGRAPYPRRDGAPASSTGRDYPTRSARPQPARRDEEPRRDERSGPRRGSPGTRPPRRGEGDAPVWYPKPKPAWRPRGGPPAGAGRAGPAGPQRFGGANGARGRADGGPPAERPARRPRSQATGEPRSSSGNADRRSAPHAGTRGRSEKKTGDARKSSRGQGPLSGRRGPGRSGPRT